MGNSCFSWVFWSGRGEGSAWDGDSCAKPSLAGCTSKEIREGGKFIKYCHLLRSPDYNQSSRLTIIWPCTTQVVNNRGGGGGGVITK